MNDWLGEQEGRKDLREEHIKDSLLIWLALAGMVPKQAKNRKAQKLVEIIGSESIPVIPLGGVAEYLKSGISCLRSQETQLQGTNQEGEEVFLRIIPINDDSGFQQYQYILYRKGKVVLSKYARSLSEIYQALIS